MRAEASGSVYWWAKIARTRPQAFVILALFGLALLRFASACASAVHFNEGDFFATLPGAYAEDWNLTLWDSPDLKNSIPGFHRHGYGYGPTQYLTLFPIVFLDSYSQIALVLLPVYVGVVMATAYVLWRLCELLVPAHDDFQWGRVMMVATAVFLFGPLLTALGQREFEVVQALMVVVAAYLLARGRSVASAAVLGYISMFKYWGLGLLGYFLLRRQWKPVLAFVGTVALVLVLAHAIFDLERFPFSNAATIDQVFGRVYRPLGQGMPFCAPATGTAANVRMGLCAVVSGRSGVAEILFYGLLLTASGLFLTLFWLFERRAPLSNQLDDRWRRILEFCFFLTGSGIVFHGHYHYLSILILPLTVLVYRAVWGFNRTQVVLTLTAVAYGMLSPFVVPISLVARVTGGDPWFAYLGSGAYFFGIIVLISLLFREYWVLLGRAGRHGHAEGPVVVS